MASVPTGAELNSLIAVRAYEIYLKRLGDPPAELSDWLTAEKEVLASFSAPALTVDQVGSSETATEKRSSRTKLSIVSKPRQQASSATRARKPKEKTE